MIYAQRFKRLINETKIPSLQIAGYGVSEPSTLFQVGGGSYTQSTQYNILIPRKGLSSKQQHRDSEPKVL